MSVKQKMLDKLMDTYNKSSDSNIGKLIQLVAEQIDKLHATNKRINDWRDIDQAEGKALDELGRDVGELRLQRSDALYRDGIKTKIKANLSKGDIETIIELALVYFGSDLIKLDEAWTLDRYDNEPAALVLSFEDSQLIENVPFKALERVIAGGVRLYMELRQTEQEIQIQTDYEEIPIVYPLSGSLLVNQYPGGLL